MEKERLKVILRENTRSLILGVVLFLFCLVGVVFSYVLLSKKDTFVCSLMLALFSVIIAFLILYFKNELRNRKNIINNKETYFKRLEILGSLRGITPLSNSKAGVLFFSLNKDSLMLDTGLLGSWVLYLNNEKLFSSSDFYSEEESKIVKELFNNFLINNKNQKEIKRHNLINNFYERLSK